MSLRRRDLRAILEFVAEAGEVEFETPYPGEIVVRIGELVPCLEIHYQEFDVRARATRALIPGDPEDDPDLDAQYWKLGPCPIVRYRCATGDLAAVRLSDVADWRRYAETPLYREYFRPSGIKHMADLGLPDRAGLRRSLVLFRGLADRDFRQRDREVLETLRPHLRQLETTAALRRRLSRRLASQQQPWAAAASPLSRREREVVELVAEGKTNAQIAAELWIAPGTVKKHLDHVYEKLGVAHRSAAATYAASLR